MKRCFLSRYSHLFMVSACMLLPGCALLDYFFGPSESQTEEAISSAEEHEMIKDAAIDLLTEEGTVVPDEGLTGKPLVTMDGVPIVTMDSLEEEKAKLLDANPQLKQMLAFMNPKTLDVNLATGLMNQAIVDYRIIENGTNKTSEYKKEIKEGYKAVERMVNTKFFTQSFDVRITDADARKFYDANKDSMPQLLLSRGGVKAMGVQFDTEAEAKAFAVQVSSQSYDVRKAAQAASIGEKVRDFALVNKQSMGIDQELRDKIMGISTFPAVETVKLKDNKVWVVAATGKEETQYQPFEQVKERIKELLEKEERSKKFDEEINKLKERYNVDMDGEFFVEEPAESMNLEEALPEDLLSQLEEDDVVGTVAYHDDVDMPVI